MQETTTIRHGRHCVFELHVHLVFVTKYRKKVFDAAMLAYLKTTFAAICLEFGAELQEMNGESDHVHLPLNYPPQIALSKLVYCLKGVSSRMLRKQIPQSIRGYWEGVLWSPSYFAASCGGAPLDIFERYIENQRVPHGSSPA